ncbi:hypothetical protein DL766_006881 [Monosporascus sp. MC13-8B]|uniref:Shugoshin C-terminal domain-containing protein n=1 Tax=Monosporascus cannonballus TaxID=155416 RepID=A0ABY0GYG7_9PEZI|nr:hypothetical protein DL762_008021 [Monosporascus cannonballus]RYO96429.1 hypothetical protein DL763_003178 [Monosporascus cannonballus]RYP25923.1 hypothetical protein DL766_006881 [Monosporascus sp. MC13-8B]
MARLNEPLVPTDNIETLRRRFLRQNRDIARINSTQSLRIRSLENECARMLSENLELRGHILRLETELQDSRAQRIADHALEIKEKMEAQLVEWGAMLAGLGHEPVPRSRSPRVAKKARTRSSLGRASCQWKRRDSIDLEALALQEGRLPPIWETKSYPRETLNREEILAICSEAAETSDSPDLGPPPVSRFVDEDPVKIDLPTRQIADDIEPPALANAATNPVSRTYIPSPAKKAEPVAIGPNVAKVEKASSAQDEKDTAPRVVKAASTAEPRAPTETVKPSLKRKSRDDEDRSNDQAALQSAEASASPEKSAVLKDRTVNRPIKEIRKDGRGKLKNVGGGSTTQRKPLGAKSSNENLGSPMKGVKPSIVDEVAKAKSDAKREEHAKSRTETRKVKAKEKETRPAPAVIEVPAPDPVIPEQAPPVAAIEIEIEPEPPAPPQQQEPDGPSTEPNPSVPRFPEPPASAATTAREEVYGTPPPLDISSRGETTRGSRRTRPAVSYAEPNLRDKMRRPTKQLLDAVAGEGKSLQMRRVSSSSSQSRQSELPTPASASSSSSSAVRPSGPVVVSPRLAAVWKNIPDASAAEATDNMPPSPLARKTAGRASPPRGSDLPTTVVTDRRKRNSSALAEPVEATSSNGKVAAPKIPTNRRLEEIAAREAEVARMFDGPDDNDNDSNSGSGSGSGSSSPTGRTSKVPTSTSRIARSKRLSSVAAAREDPSEQQNEKRAKSGTSAVVRKRASTSMMAVPPAKSRMGIDNDDAGQDSSSLDGDSGLTASSADSPGGARSSARGERASSMRRRSMML